MRRNQRSAGCVRISSVTDVGKRDADTATFLVRDDKWKLRVAAFAACAFDRLDAPLAGRQRR